MNARTTILAAALLATVLHHPSYAQPNGVLDLGGHRQLMVDRQLIDRLEGADLVVQQPRPGDVVLVTGEPWEGNTCAYYTIFQDGDLYRMYYRGSHADEKTRRSLHPEVTCYAESRDGLHWTKPRLGICSWNGSTENNIIWDGIGTHNFTPFRDENPECPAEARYKALGVGEHNGKRGLFAFQSRDAIHWTLMRDEPVITRGAFDSQNLAFWDPVRRLYVDYHRTFTDGVRAIMTCTSRDFLEWTEPELLTYQEGAPVRHLYTNAIRSYFRAPRFRLGWPTRFIPENNQVEPIFMASRDGRHFQRWPDPVIPRTAPKDRDGNRSNYMANGLVQLPGNDRELAVYGTEAYYAGPDSRLRHFAYRVDGFVALHAENEGELVTRPIQFTGDRLTLNLVTAGDGRVTVELQDIDGQPLPGLSQADCDALQGDAIDQEVTWRGSADVGAIAGKPVRLRLILNKADVFAFQFQTADKSTQP